MTIVIAMPYKRIEENKCLTDTEKCRYLRPITCRMVTKKPQYRFVTDVYGCCSEAETCCGCCRDMRPIKKEVSKCRKSKKRNRK